MEPRPAAETASPPEGNDGEGSRRRKISWVALCVVLFVPACFAVGLLAFLGATRGRDLLESYHLAALVPSPTIILVGAFIITAGLTMFLARRGLRRGWNSARGLRRGWSFTGVLILALAAGSFLLLRRDRHARVDMVVSSQARQLAAAADQYFLENGVSTVSYDSLVGATNYVKAVFPTHQEIYPANYTQGITITVMHVEGVRTVTYSP